MPNPSNLISLARLAIQTYSSLYPGYYTEEKIV